jgi:hypothetical protein
MKPKQVFVLATLTALVISTFAILPTFAITPRIYLSPTNSIYTTDTVSAGFKFNVTVWTQDVANVGAGQIYMEFNDTIINVTRWFEPKTDPQYIFYGKATSALPTPPDPGYVHLGPNQGSVMILESLFPAPPSQPAFSGTGKICIFEFIIKTVPSTSGKFTSLLAIDFSSTYLLDSDANEVTLAKENGYYEVSRPGPKHSLTITKTLGGNTNPAPGTHEYSEGTIVSVTALPSINYALDHWELDGSNIGAPNPTDVTMNVNHTLHAVFVYSPPAGSRMFVDPPEIIDPTAVPCQTNFNINVSIDDVANMKTAQFNMTYDSNVISIIGLNFLKVNGQYPVLSINANGTAGFIWMGLTYSTAVTASDPTPIVTITFHVTNLGATPLNLTDTKMTDPLGNSIPHQTYDGFFMALIRDVAVTNIVPSRTWAYTGWPVNITVTVKNKGNATETFNVTAYYDTDQIGIMTVTNLAPNEERNIIFEWNTTSVAEGNYVIKAIADILPYEFKTSDNTLTDGIVYILDLASVHDVAIVDTVTKAWVYQGVNVFVNVTAQNVGVFSESFDVNVYFNGTLMKTMHITDLAAGAYYTARFNITTSTLLWCHVYQITAEAVPVPYEYNAANNFFTDGYLKIRIAGDTNGDGKVDLKDVYAVQKAFGTSPGHLRWDPLCDLNGDNKVDLKDVYIVNKNYGKHC